VTRAGLVRHTIIITRPQHAALKARAAAAHTSVAALVRVAIEMVLATPATSVEDIIATHGKEPA
jgi:hypothetical protein